MKYRLGNKIPGFLDGDVMLAVIRPYPGFTAVSPNVPGSSPEKKMENKFRGKGSKETSNSHLFCNRETSKSAGNGKA